MQAIATKSLGNNNPTGLEQRIAVWSINIDAQEEIITVGYCIETISPTGLIVNRSPKQFYTRRNIAEQRTPEPESELISSANMKFDALRESPTGQQIAAMIAADLEEYPEF